MATFHKIKVKEVYKETDDCSVVNFDIPDALRKDFSFTQGQHLTLKKNFNGKDFRRSYSLCSSPVEHQWRIAVKQIPGGAGKVGAPVTIAVF